MVISLAAIFILPFPLKNPAYHLRMPAFTIQFRWHFHGCQRRSDLPERESVSPQLPDGFNNMLLPLELGRMPL